MNQTITQGLLARGYGDATHAEVRAAGGNLIEKRGNYAFYAMEDGSRIAVPLRPLEDRRFYVLKPNGTKVTA